MESLGHPTFVVALRLKNIAAFALGKMDQWGLTNGPMKEDPWDYVHITTLNFLPFVLRRVGVAAGWVVSLLTGVWFASLAFIRNQATRKGFGAAEVPAISAEVPTSY